MSISSSSFSKSPLKQQQQQQEQIPFFQLGLMEQTRFWMLTKRKHSLRSHVEASMNSSSYNDSWEEQAFAEDAAGPLGGCIWPPRSYSCSFCRREFRSAQALGGHMNVHRRDRARLKQSPSSSNEILHDQRNQNIIQNSCTSSGVQYPSQVCTLVYNPNSLPPSPSSVSVPSTKNYRDQPILISSNFSSIAQETHKGNLFSHPPSWSDSIAVRVLGVSDSKVGGEDNSRKEESGCNDHEGGHVKPELSVSLNLFVHPNRSPVSGCEEKTGTISRKRRRTDASSLPFFLEPSSVLGFSPSSVEDIDLELRLGDRPKVK